MTCYGKVTTVAANGYRVNVNGNVSWPLKRLSGAVRLAADTQGVLARASPKIGDKVLCWFPGEALADGCIIGIVEEG